LAEAADMLETCARIAPHAQPASAPAAAISVATASVRLDPAQHFDEARRCLSNEETQRTALFFKNADRVRYALAHAMLRTLLARRLQAAPAEIAFATSPNGKPRLVGQRADVAFNLSYGDGMAVLAFAHRPVGVDVEAVRDDLEFGEIGRRFFRSDELRYLESGPDSSGGPGVRNRFFRLWTRKEAVLKALGVGLSGIGELSVLDDLLVADGAQGGAMRIALRTLPGPPGHALALAVEARGGA
jgi:4'-phosphopantetheinyl transferase